MNRLTQKFQQLKKENTKAILPYITPEFPIAGTTVPLILALEKAGASIIEVGIPFSDPLADGPTIQQSSHTAIQNGATISLVLQRVKEARLHTQIPIVLMGYINPVLHYGIEKFLVDASASGVDGLIIPDLLPEESTEYRMLAAKYNISVVFLLAPTSSDKRIHHVDSLSTDFTYCVSVTGVTGSRNTFDSLDDFLRRVRRNSTKPFVVGFGISTHDHVQQVWKHADGAVVGSALIQKIAHEKNSDAVAEVAGKFLSTLIRASLKT